MKNYINNFDIDLTCPKCKGSFKVSSTLVGTTVFCQHCSQAIELIDNGFSTGLNEANKKLNDLTKDLKKMFK